MYKVKREFLERPLVDCNDLLNAICYAVKPSLEDKTGIDCVLRAQKNIAPVVDEVLSEADMEWLGRRLEKLPRLHGGMAEDELKLFWDAYEQLGDLPDWSLVLQPESEFAQCEGITCCYRKIVKKEPFDLGFALRDSERADLSKILGELPPLHGRMTQEEIETFLEAYRNHPGRLTWEPGLITAWERSADEIEMTHLKETHAKALDKAIKDGAVIALTKDHVPRRFLGMGIYLPQEEVKKYLRQIGLYTVLESPEAAAPELLTNAPESMQELETNSPAVSEEEKAEQAKFHDRAEENELEHDVPAVINTTSHFGQKTSFASAPTYEQMARLIDEDDAPNGDEMRSLLAKAMREVKSHEWSPIFEWLLDEAERVKTSNGNGVKSILTGVVNLTTPRSIEWKKKGLVKKFTPPSLRKRLDRIEADVQERLRKSVPDSSIQ